MNKPDKPLLPLPGLATLLVAALGLAIGWIVWQSGEGRRRQEDLSRLKDALRDPEAPLRERLQSIELWVGDGPDCVPELIDELDSSSPRVRAAATTALARIRPLPAEAIRAVLGALDDSSADVRLTALAGVRGWKEHRVLDIQPWIPRLVRLIDDPDPIVAVDACAMVGHARADSATAAELTALTNSERLMTRFRAAGLIRTLRLFDDAAVEAMRRLLKDPDEHVRDAAFGTLIASGHFTVEDVLAGLESGDESVISLACRALEPFGIEAAIATGRLRELLRSGQSTASVHHALWQSTQNTVSVLHALAAIGTRASDAVPEVLELLARSDEDSFGKSDDSRISYSRALIRGAAFRCLARISTDESLIVATLREGLVSPNHETSRFAGEVLREFSPQHARKSVPSLLQPLAERDDAGQVPLLRALGGLGPEASGAVPAIVERLDSKVPFGHSLTVGYYAAQTLGQIGPAAAEAVPALAAAAEAELQRDGPRRIHLQALYHIGVASRAAERVLIRRIRQELEWLGRNPRPDREASQSERSDFGSHVALVATAVLALGRVGQGSETAYQTVSDVLGELQHAEHGQATSWDLACVYWALADLRLRPEETVAVLLKAARRETPRPPVNADHPYVELPASSRPTEFVRLAAIRGLGCFPECADRCVPCLVELLQDDDHRVQRVAAVALGNLGARAESAVPALESLASDPAAPVALDEASGATVWSDELPDPIFQLGWPSQLTLRDVALRSLAQIRATHQPVAAPRPR